MKKKRVIILVIILLAVLLLAAVAIWYFSSGAKIEQNEFEKSLIGRWAYAHSPEEEIISFRTNGKAKYEGKTYDFTSDGTYFHLTNGTDEPRDIRYVQEPERNRMYIYIKSKYVREIGDTADGIVGVWRCAETNWTFEFTAKDTFMEDGALTGHYVVDEENGVIKLLYERYLEDTTFFYRLEGDELYIEYPWLMVPVNSN